MEFKMYIFLYADLETFAVLIIEIQSERRFGDI